LTIAEEGDMDSIMNSINVVLGVVGAILSAITIAAIFYGPIAALKIQRKLDEEREAKSRKLQIFKTLMSNRATRLSPAYVQALNLIDVEFTGSSQAEKSVREAWNVLLDLYADYEKTVNAEEKADELNAQLLDAMAKSLGYDFGKVHLKKGAYYPILFRNIEVEQHTLRRALLSLLDGTGKLKLPVATFDTSFPDVKLPEVPKK
jgi:hypothetical protein